MDQRDGLRKLIHALLWLRSEQGAPPWTMPGVYFALCELEKVKKTFYQKSPHRQRQCKRCGEILGVAVWGGR